MANFKEIAKFLGKQVGLGRPLACPRCSDDNGLGDNPDGKQLMSSMGDYENQLFCPHCDLSVDLVVTHGPYREKDEISPNNQ